MRRALSLEDKILAIAIINYLQYNQSVILPPAILDIIQELRQSRSKHWLLVTDKLVAFCSVHRQYRDALPVCRDASKTYQQTQTFST